MFFFFLKECVSFFVTPIQCGDWVVGLFSIFYLITNHFKDVYRGLFLCGEDRKKENNRRIRLVE